MKGYPPDLLLGRSQLKSTPSNPKFPKINSSTDWETVSHQTAAKIHGGIASLQRDTSLEPKPSPTPPKPVTSKSSTSQWSVALQNLLDQPPAQFPKILMLGGLAFCCLFGTWAWFGKVQEVSHAQGRLVPQGEVYKVQPVSQGEIAKILVKEGQHVQAGDVIIKLDSRLADAEIDRLQQSLSAYRLQLSQSQSLIEQTQLGLATQQAIANAETRAQEATIDRINVSTQTTQSILNQLQKESSAYEARLSRLKPLLEEGVIAKDRIFEIEQSLQERHRAVLQQQGQLNESLKETDRLQAELSQQKAKGQYSQLEAKQRIQQLEMEASQLKAKIAETETLLKAAHTQLEQLYLYAPVSGLVSSLKVQNSGEVAQPGKTVAEIIPEHAPLILSAILPNDEAGLVQAGMKAQIKFNAFPYQEYGIASGKVISISPDAEIDERMGAVYQVKIALDRKAVSHEGRRIDLKAGQTAQAEIVTRQRRILDILLDPIRKLQVSEVSL